VTVHDLSGGADVLGRIGRIAQSALDQYDVSDRAEVQLLNVSENATYLVTDPDRDISTVLRVHRGGYHSPAAIESELAWLCALRDDTGIRTPQVIGSRSGSRVVQVATPDGDDSRNCVMFERLPGTEPSPDTLVEDFQALGDLTARMHQHTRQWTPPAAFTRFSWDYDAAFGAEARWGRWRDGHGMEPATVELLSRLGETLQRRLAAFGKGPERFGLIHADLRLANLLVQAGQPPAVIDFDDCGFGWYLYDLGSAVSFIEHDPKVPEMIDAWVRGYRGRQPLPDEDVDEIWTFVLYRRLLLVAWIGSHSAADVARELGAGYTAGTCELAEGYLSRFG
jgi:Ser/Thr protein kinase RdoA (MazF antagonist)